MNNNAIMSHSNHLIPNITLLLFCKKKSLLNERENKCQKIEIVLLGVRWCVLNLDVVCLES